MSSLAANRRISSLSRILASQSTRRCLVLIKDDPNLLLALVLLCPRLRTVAVCVGQWNSADDSDESETRAPFVS